VGLSTDDKICEYTSFTKNGEGLLNMEIMARFLEKLIASPEVSPLLSKEHFSVDVPMLQALAPHASQ